MKLSTTLCTTLSSHFSVNTSSHCSISTLLRVNYIDYNDDSSDNDNGVVFIAEGDETVKLKGATILYIDEDDAISERCVCRS